MGVRSPNSRVRGVWYPRFPQLLFREPKPKDCGVGALVVDEADRVASRRQARHDRCGSIRRGRPHSRPAVATQRARQCSRPVTGWSSTSRATPETPGSSCRSGPGDTPTRCPRPAQAGPQRRAPRRSPSKPVGAAPSGGRPLRSIVGMVEPTLHFDAQFRPDRKPCGGGGSTLRSLTGKAPGCRRSRPGKGATATRWSTGGVACRSPPHSAIRISMYGSRGVPLASAELSGDAVEQEAQTQLELLGWTDDTWVGHPARQNRIAAAHRREVA